MVAYLRQFLVVLLVLLQTAAPLVHAHVGGDAGDCGIHLHGLESLQSEPDQWSLPDNRHELHQQAAVVSVGSAIKLQMMRERLVPLGFLLPSVAEPKFYPPVRPPFYRSLVSPPPTAPLLADNASRAPPGC
ncbi:hypothetical protein ACH518_04360 [Methylomonas sp. HW2-6]|uniref:hypothetical protein n=1 Tax=Methylomonas sp. HW2-6 TaxID=3376687 RepID=UPI0040411264